MWEKLSKCNNGLWRRCLLEMHPVDADRNVSAFAHSIHISVWQVTAALEIENS